MAPFRTMLPLLLLLLLPLAAVASPLLRVVDPAPGAVLSESSVTVRIALDCAAACPAFDSVCMRVLFGLGSSERRCFGSAERGFTLSGLSSDFYRVRFTLEGGAPGAAASVETSFSVATSVRTPQVHVSFPHSILIQPSFNPLGAHAAGPCLVPSFNPHSTLIQPPRCARRRSMSRFR